ncbi:SpoIIE family protein phosphatase [Streptomyces flavalbus]|uniref:SpoIIE family protein phosphatase n=1 Tax=Streptomyces flavalbus TaxID=2665155 RepID=A0ABW2WJ44_9ACTN
MTSEPVVPPERGAAAEAAATSAVLERARGAVMALTGCSADAAFEELTQRAKAGGRTLIEECWRTLGGLPRHAPDATPRPPGTTPRSPGATPPPSTATPRPPAAAVPPDSLAISPDASRPRADGAPPAAPRSPADAISPDNTLQPSPDAISPDTSQPPADAISPDTSQPPADAVSPDASRSPADGVPGAADRAGVLARLGVALVAVRDWRELARCLWEHLGPPVGADAVMVYVPRPDGGLELAGHAGIDDALAARWRQVPPLRGLAPLDALRTGEPRWLAEAAVADERYPVIGDPPERWRSRAWLPVPTGPGGPGVAVGVLRERGEPFGPEERELLRAVVPLCAGRLRDLGPTGPRDALDAVAAAFDVLPGAVALLRPVGTAADDDYDVVAATPEAADALGRPGRPPTGLRLRECWPGAHDRLWPGLRRALETGEPYEAGPFVVGAGAAEPVTYAVRAERLGDGLIVTWPRVDPSDRQERRLADVQRLGNLGWANWNLVTHEALWSDQMRTVLGLAPDDDAPLPLTALPDLAVPEDRPLFTGAVRALVREGRPLDVPFRVRAGGAVRYLRAVAEATTDVHGTPVEVHGFVQDLTAQRSAELALVESERAILVQHGVLQAERALAGRLQHALLPLPRRQPVRLAGLRVEVAYLPAQSGLHVGGDWFSAIELPDGTALFVVGDVAGHGVDAVATMAQLRFTAKGMVSTGSSPTGALNRLNTLLLHSHDSHGTATLVLARYHPEGRRLVWAQAGHLPPLLKRGGEVRYLDRPAGMLLGASATPAFEEAECRLEPGDRLLLYTDGLVERPGECLDVGLKRLATATKERHSEVPGSLSPLLSAMLEGERRDDVCVLDIRVPDGAA